MEPSSLEKGLQQLEAELEDAFGRIQERLKFLRTDLASDVPVPPETGQPEQPEARSGRREAFERVDSLGDWLLKDDVMSIPHQEPSLLSGDALHLSAEVLGTSALSHLRLNSHLLELSMRAAESVHALKKGGLRTTLPSTRSMSPHALARGANTELETCESVLQVIPPNSKFRLAWDLCGVCLIVLDAFLLPMTMAWEWEITPMPTTTGFSSRVLQLFAILSLFFWPLDIMVNFNTAFYIRGFIETRRWEIAKRYAYTWLGFDVCVVAVDYAAGLLGQAGSSFHDFCG